MITSSAAPGTEFSSQLPAIAQSAGEAHVPAVEWNVAPNAEAAHKRKAIIRGLMTSPYSNEQDMVFNVLFEVDVATGRNL